MWQVVAYKVDCSYCGTDNYGFGIFRKENLEDELHLIAMEWDNNYGFEEEEAEELIEEGMEEEEACDTAHENKDSRVNYEFKVLFETEDESEANLFLEQTRNDHCPSEFISDSLNFLFLRAPPGFFLFPFL